MRQRLTIILTFLVIIGALVILNTITYVKDEQLQDSEIIPNRSTYHSGPTGTRALHDFLSESGYKVMRWRDAPEKLLGETGENVATFVVIGSTRLPFSEEQIQALRQWVARGGCFVLIDREPMQAGMSDWSITALATDFPAFETDPADATQMTEKVTPAAPVQPTRLTHNVSTILPSRFASRIMINPAIKKEEEAKKEEANEDSVFEDFEDESPPPAVVFEPDGGETVSYAPVVHIGDKSGQLFLTAWREITGCGTSRNPLGAGRELFHGSAQRKKVAVGILLEATIGHRNGARGSRQLLARAITGKLAIATNRQARYQQQQTH